MIRNSPSCPYQANTAGCRKGSRPTLVTMSLSFTRGWPKAFGTANLSALDLMLPSLDIVYWTRSCELRKPELGRGSRTRDRASELCAGSSIGAVHGVQRGDDPEIKRCLANRLTAKYRTGRLITLAHEG